MRPNATTARRLFISPIVAFRKSRQCVISCGGGLLSGGTQRTALVRRQSSSSNPSSTLAAYRPRAKPNSVKVAYRRSPALSPVNGRPVRLAPRSPGARPTIKSRALLGPKESTGALNQSGSLWRHAWRNATSRGQRGQSRPGIPLGRTGSKLIISASRVAAKIARRAGERRRAYRQHGRAVRQTRRRFSAEAAGTKVFCTPASLLVAHDHLDHIGPRA